jgi:hypothetical protein
MLYLCQKYDKDEKISYAFDSDRWVSFCFLCCGFVGGVGGRGLGEKRWMS